MPEVRSRQISLAAAACGVSSERWIQACITSGLLSLAAEDGTFAISLMRSAGIPWEEIQSIVKQAVEDSDAALQAIQIRDDSFPPRRPIEDARALASDQEGQQRLLGRCL